MDVIECISCGLEIFGKRREPTMCSTCEENQKMKDKLKRYEKALKEIAEQGGKALIGKLCAKVAKEALDISDFSSEMPLQKQQTKKESVNEPNPFCHKCKGTGSKPHDGIHIEFVEVKCECTKE